MRYLLCVAVLIVGCGKAQTGTTTPRAVTQNGVTIIGTLPVGPMQAETLNELPNGATFRWSEPTAHFVGAEPAREDPAAPRAADDLRADVSLILRLHGWQEAKSGEDPMFELAVGRYERTVKWLEQVADSPPQPADPRRCANLSPGQRARCEEPRSQPRYRQRQSTQSHVAFAIVRIRDNATAWWIAPSQKDIQVLTLELFSAAAEGVTAFVR